MIVYISGSISDGGTLPIEVQEQRRAEFYRAEEVLQAWGYRTLNPMRHGVSEGVTWQHFMRLALVDLSQAEGVAMLDGWKGSRGAKIERRIALNLDYDVRPLSKWLVL